MGPFFITFYYNNSRKELMMNNANSNETKAQHIVACCAPISGRRAIFWGGVLVLLGAFGLLSIWMPAQQLGRFVLPAFFLLWGGALLVGARKA
jgi:hypothetical protein